MLLRNAPDTTHDRREHQARKNKGVNPGILTFCLPFFLGSLVTIVTKYTENIFKVIFTLTYVLLSTVTSLYCLHLIAAPSTVE